ncbi:glycosyltransferase family 2 protein [Pedobacter sp. MW01-1-1]|uniref:glycosyltransferase family 2 protein n=1 Tax=Pedobacter sp. MW01-1-1 TaxID=3383027 RepID=UPI003FF064BD
MPTVPIEREGLLAKLPKTQNKKGWIWDEEVNPKNYSSSVNWPKLTIVTPSYNQVAFLEQTIRSVLLQNYPNLEYIIIDGGSTDGSIEIIKKYTPWISYWQSAKDNGQGQAINQGFSLASGDYHAWINSDDYYEKDAFHLAISTFLKSKADFIYGYSQNYHVQSGKTELIKVQPLHDYFLRIPTLQQPACFWKANIHQPIWEKLQCSLDYELWLRMVKGKRKKLIKKILATANVHEEAKTHNPQMGISWKRDHELICHTDAHGPAYNWNRLILLNKIYLKLNKFLESIFKKNPV